MALPGFMMLGAQLIAFVSGVMCSRGYFILARTELMGRDPPMITVLIRMIMSVPRMTARVPDFVKYSGR